MLPTQRTLAWLRRRRRIADVTERWLPKTRKRKDLFGFVDIVALESGVTGVLGIQATSGGNVMARVAKILELDTARLWLECGNRLWVVGWTKKKVDGKRNSWQRKIVIVTLTDFEVVDDLARAKETWK